MKDIWRTQRDLRTDIPAGPIDVQRFKLQFESSGIKTFFHLPVARTPEDLKAGKVDIAFFGAPQGIMPHSSGCVWAPAEIRHTRDYGTYGPPGFLGFIDYETLIDPFETLRGVDYGDAAHNPYSYERTLEEIRRTTREIVETGAIPFCVGGDHSIPNGTFRGVVDVYGRGNVGFMHFDAHLDRSSGKFGSFYHSGSYMTMAVEEGLIKGEHVVQYGMNSYNFGADHYDEILKEGGKVYHIHEIERDGVEATFEKIYEDFKDVDKIYVSFDIDTFDASYAPATGSSTFAGSTPRELLPYLRQFAATKTIVGFDLVEYNPFYDNRGQQTARLLPPSNGFLPYGHRDEEEGHGPGLHPSASQRPALIRNLHRSVSCVLTYQFSRRISASRGRVANRPGAWAIAPEELGNLDAFLTTRNLPGVTMQDIPNNPKSSLQRWAWIIATRIFGAMDEFRFEQLTNDQMKRLSPIIADAVYEALHSIYLAQHGETRHHRLYGTANVQCALNRLEGDQLPDLSDITREFFSRLSQSEVERYAESLSEGCASRIQQFRSSDVHVFCDERTLECKS